MNNVARLLAADAPSPQLSPAAVLRAEPFIEVERPNGQCVTVTLATAAPYRPTKGDQVLVIGNDEGWYLIGIIAARGASAIEVEGDLTIEAQGHVRLIGRNGVSVEGPEVQLKGDRLLSLFGSVTERFTTLFQSVRELASKQAGRLETTVEGTHHTRARNANLVTRERVKINGKTIHLG